MQHINSFTGGMKRAIDYTLVPQDSYRYMLNGHLISKDEHGWVITGLKGNKSIAQFGSDECPIGSVSTNGILYIITHKIEDNLGFICFYTIKGSTGNGWTSNTMLPLPYQMGESYTAFKISNSVLKFTRDKLLEVLAKDSYDGSVDLYIGDGLNLNVVINTGLDREGKFTNRVYSSLDNISLFEMQKSVNKIPTITGTIKDNGNLKPGTYYVYLRYLDESLNTTPFIAEAGPFFIHAGSSDNDTLSGVFNENYKLVNKSINLKIESADELYKKINIAVVYYYGNNGIISRDNYLLDRTYVLDDNNSCKVSLNGLNKQQTLVLEDLYRDNLSLNKNVTHIQHDDYYVGANWSGNVIDYTELKILASKFIPHAILKENDFNSNNFDKVCDETCSEFEYKENEVYPLGVVFLIDGQYKTPVFPICGWYEGYNDEDGTSNTIYVQGGTFTRTLIEFELVWLAKSDNYAFDVNNKYGYAGEIRLLSSEAPTSDVVIVLSTNEEPAKLLEVTFPAGSTSVVWFVYKTNISVLFDSFNITNGNAWQDTLHYYKLNEIQGIAKYKTNSNISDVVALNNGKGLYKFPAKKLTSNGEADNVLHYMLMGLKIEDVLAKDYYNLNSSKLPNITAIYYVQGNRIENFITQGLSIATTSVVGYSTSFKDHNTNKIANITQMIAFGNGESPLYYPYLDASYKGLFPVMKIDNRLPTKSLLYNQYPSSISQLRVGNNEEFLISNVTETEDMEATVIPTGLNNDLYRDRLGVETALNDLYDLTTKHFAIFSPDIILNKDLRISKAYIKSVGYFNRPRNEVLVNSTTYDPAKYTMYTGQQEFGEYHTYNDLLPRILNQSYEDTDLGEVMTITDDTKIYEVESTFINSNISISETNGFISRMKSIYEVFGEDHDDEEISNSIKQFLSTNRNDLTNAGIILNRNKIDSSSTNEELPNIDANQDLTHSYAFNKTKVVPISTNSNNQLPLLATNLSMNTSPYLGVIHKNDVHYTKVINRSMQNAIVNIYRYEKLEDYLQAIEDEYDILSEEYNIINASSNWLDETPKEIYKGDIFSQKVFMRINRWSDEIDSYKSKVDTTIDWEYGWKQGTAMYVYMQLTRNANLRVPSADSTFYPFALSESSKGSISVMKDFVWKSSLNKYMNETWDSNDGYNQLKSLFKFYAFDELQYNISNNKPNRIHWSNKHISGSFIDQYRTFPLLQYRDIGIAYGAILKLAKFNNTLFSIQESAINQHFQSERLQSMNDSSEIILGDRTLISDTVRQLADFGTQHKESIIETETSIYGIDWKKEKIWMIKGAATQSGGTYFGVDTIETSKSMSDLFKVLKSQMVDDNLIQNLMGEVSTGIHSAYDDTNKEILFTFKLGLCTSESCEGTEEKTYTLVYSELLNVFTGYYSYNKNIYIRFENKLLSYTKGKQDLWLHNVGDFQNIDGQIEPFVLEFIINGLSESQNVVQYEKEFLAHLLNASPMILDSVTWETEYQSSEKSPFINQQQFWSNPEYIEHNWSIPIIPNMDNNRGPVRQSHFNSFEKNSNMRGQWIKVKITYTPTESESEEQQFYIRNMITNFIISFT